MVILNKQSFPPINSMLRTLLKYIFFTSTVLLIGQIQVAGDTVGSHFKRQVFAAGTLGGRKLLEAKWVSDITPQAVTRWINAPTPPKSQGRGRQANLGRENRVTDMEEYSTSDRESMLRILQ